MLWANSLARMVSGLCDNLLLSTIGAWDITELLGPVRELPRQPLELVENGVEVGEEEAH
jgi:hypothetical protein